MTDHTSPADPIDYPDVLTGLSRNRMEALEFCASAVLIEAWQDARVHAMTSVVLDAAIATALREYTDLLRTSATVADSDQGAA